jgi:hypothetical protein
VVNIFGPTEMVSQHKDGPIARFMVEGLCGGTPDAVPEQYRLSSPLTFVTKDDQGRSADPDVPRDGGQHRSRPAGQAAG